LADPQRQVGMVELVVAHPQAIAWLTGIHRVSAIGEGIAHVFQGTGRRQQLGLEGSRHGNTLGGISQGWRFYGKNPSKSVSKRPTQQPPGPLRRASGLQAETP